MKIFVIFFMCSFMHVVIANNTLTFIGTAYDIKSDNILYQEEHIRYFTSDKIIKKSNVVYKNPNGDIIANKEIEYDISIFAPSFQFKDLRTNTVIRVDNSQNALSVKYESFDTSINETLKKVDDLVIDAGFDQLLEEYWDTLLNGNWVTFNFLAPSRGQLIGFEIKQLSKTDTEVKFVLQPQNWLYQMLVDEIILTYDLATKKILQYEGLTNIEEVKNDKPTGSHVSAVIKYVY